MKLIINFQSAQAWLGVTLLKEFQFAISKLDHKLEVSCGGCVTMAMNTAKTQATFMVPKTQELVQTKLRLIWLASLTGFMVLEGFIVLALL